MVGNDRVRPDGAEMLAHRADLAFLSRSPFVQAVPEVMDRSFLPFLPE